MGSVYFVDDNFIGNRKAALDLLPHLIEWQKKTGYVLRFSCEATLNIAKRPEILAGMREAFFGTIFCGIETPDPVALKAMHKDHNMMVPIMEAIHTLNSFGMEVVSGIILGLDTDKPETGAHLLEFIDASQIPLLTINLLQALPKTPLWDRLKRENRLIEDEGRDSNVDFFLPYEDVVGSWRACMGSAYEPAKLLARYEYQIRETYPKRLQPRTPQQATWKNIKLGLTMLRNIFWQVGILGDYKREFWKFALRRLARGEFEYLIASIMVAHHLINFARDASGGQTNASYYSLKLQEASVPAE
jgi:radical SAM superfamily enzyme YgiQ (UPF0313 family)